LDIKLKSKYVNIIAFIIGVYMISLSSLTVVGFVEGREYLNKSYREYIAKNPKLESEIFESELKEYFNNVRALTTDFKYYSQKSDEDKVSQYEADVLKLNYDAELHRDEKAIEDKYKNEIDAAVKQGDKVTLSKLTQEKNKKIEEVRKEKTKKLQDAKNEIIARKDSKYTHINEYIQTRVDVKYYIKDVKNEQQYTNFKEVPNIEEYIKEKALYSVKFPLKSTNVDNLSYASNWFFDHNFEGYFIIENQQESTKTLQQAVYSELQLRHDEYVSLREKTIEKGIISIFALPLGLFLLLYVLKTKGQGIPYIEKMMNVYKKIPVDLRICMLIIYLLYMFNYVQELNFLNKSFNIEYMVKPVAIEIYIIYLIFNIKHIMKFTKDKEEFVAECKKSIIYRLLVLVKESLMVKSIMIKISIIFILTALWGAFVVIAIIEVPVRALLPGLILLGCVLLYGNLLVQYVLRKVILFNKIVKGTEEIALGNLNYIIEEKGLGNLSKLAHNINNMKDGFKRSVDNEMKSERMKSELITNVSHDLKTPLTSIINYVNLLKKQDISVEERTTYIEVLDRKSQRLKVLIEDLFDVSKISSGAVELNIERVDVAALLKQAMGEFDERIKKSFLTFKVNTPKDNVYANLDGKKTWRVFENLISNILKYSQPSTRVYIDLIEEENKVIVIMKNISAYEMEFEVSEIFERFKRGDQSRSTEGSGLGLAIAKSIVELQGGEMNIDIDGDLFKVIVEFNK
jgi:signal transduction histidine kinase